ncbi:helix-turn-helix domain-containing protein [Micromonospora sp. NPDC049559]|uniref:winged helix-turn-helix transcriptional regulator n=1 Tax=Micromonospora sp. NPDC049559 TaxID=3155923 RepID=UPI00344A447A
MTTTTARPDPETCVRAEPALVSAFTLLGKRWSGSILEVLRHGPIGFREISRAVDGVSDSVLADRLAELAEKGLVARTVESGPPVGVTYELTRGGRELLPALDQLARWADTHLRD